MALSVFAAGPSERAAWDAYVESRPQATGYHRWAWRHVFEEAFGHETVYLAARDEGGFRGVLPLVKFRSLLFGRLLVSLPFVNYGGVVADDEPAARALLEAALAEARAHRAKHVELRHMARWFPELAVKQHKVQMRLALAATHEAAWKALDNKVRNQVRKAEKSGLTREAGGLELVDDFYAVFAQNMRDLGTPVYTRRLFEAVLRHFPADASLHIVRLGSVPVAGGVLVGYRTVVENIWASSLREHRALCPNMLLYWGMFQHAIDNGREVFDFGRSTPDEGTYKFKVQWGARPEPVSWEYWLADGATLPDHSPENSRFAAAVRAWTRLPLWVANTLGPPIVRHIP
jgi:serine/alanine adding enzyme